MYQLISGVKPSHVEVAVPIDQCKSQDVLLNWRELPTQMEYKPLLAVRSFVQRSSEFINSWLPKSASIFAVWNLREQTVGA